MKKLAVIIPAAGSGSRMGGTRPKPFLEIGGRSILSYTIEAFLKVDEVAQVIVPVSEEWMGEVQGIFESLKSRDVDFEVVNGGSERQYSIYNALKKVDDKVDLIAVHDAVRPFISETLIKKTCKMAFDFGGAIVGVPAKDTIKQVDDELSIRNTPDRKFLWQAQTPQIFKKELLIKAYESAINESFIGTDDASLVERIGGEVKMVEGERENLKITYPVDLKIAELIITEKERE